MSKIVGIDLAGVESRDTGFCVLDDELNADVCILHTDNEILDKIIEVKPVVVAIDAPLSLPKGRESLEVKTDIHFRECDRELLKMKIKFFPITLGPMRKLTARGIRLKGILDKRNFDAIEVYPGAAQDIWNIVRKQYGLSKLKKGLEKLGVNRLKDSMTGDELDAVTAALVGKCYVDGNYLGIGAKTEGVIILPKR